MSEILDVKKYTYLEEENFLFDANIWLTILAPNNFEAELFTETYTRMLRDILSLNCIIYTNDTIVSEVVNRISHDEYNLYKDPNAKEFTYKIFRGLEDYKEIASFISDQIRLIADYTKLCDINIEKNNLLYDLADIFEDCKHDFNDIIILKMCEEKSLTLVTHDGDFKDCGLKVITANRFMLDSN